MALLRTQLVFSLIYLLCFVPQGVLTYEMLAGVTPFYAEDAMSIYENILQNKVQPPSFFSKVNRVTRPYQAPRHRVSTYCTHFQ